MTHDRLKIYFRQMQLTYDLNEDGVEENVVVSYDTTLGIAVYVAGSVPSQSWQEMTDDTTGLDSLSLGWDKVNQASTGGSTNEGGSNYDKGITATLDFSGAAFNFIWNWLLTESWQILNAVEVKIYDAICGKQFRLFEIKADNLKYLPYDECQLSVTLREQDLKWHAVFKTVIFDNWQNWFTKAGTKEHPMFLTCIEPRPRILSSVRVGLHIFLRAFNTATLGIPGLVGLIDEDDDRFREIVALNRFVAAPFVRDYITNVCNKFGIAIDTMFHDPTLPYYNVCVFHPNSGFMEEYNGSSIESPILQFDYENRWLIALADFADLLRPVFEAEWYVTPNNTFVFKPTIELLQLQTIYDFTAPGAFVINNDLSYTFNGDKKAAYGRYQYTVDGSDLSSQEIQALYNDIVDYDGPANNPMLEGEKNKTNQFAPTAFLRDGRTGNYAHYLVNDGETISYILIGMLSIVAVSIAGGAITVTGAIILAAVVALLMIFVASVANDLRDITDQPEYQGAVRMVAEQTMAPRLLLWDGVDMARAKTVRSNAPQPNLYYNPTSIDYFTQNKADKDSNSEHYLYNYPMYFESMYKDNLFDRFHDAIDNPLKSLENNQTFQFTIDLCCEALDVFGCCDGGFIKIGYIIKIESRPNYDVYGRLENIQVNYDGFTIMLKGKVIKKKK